MIADSSSGVGVVLPSAARGTGLEGGFVTGIHVVVRLSSCSREWRRARGLHCWRFTWVGGGKAVRGSMSEFVQRSSREDAGGRDMRSEGGDGASR